MTKGVSAPPPRVVECVKERGRRQEHARVDGVPGTTLGAYAVTAKIGEGGMGEVYRARDTKLKRQVAIKILPLSLAANADRLARL